MLKKNRLNLKKILYDIVHKAGDGARYYVHVNWSDSSGGHEFIIINIKSSIYLVDSQVGLMVKITPDKQEKSIDKYFDIEYKNSYTARLDDKDIDTDIMKYNNMSMLVSWDKNDYNLVESSVISITEAADIEEEMKPIVDILNSKGFKVKYANPGHLNFRSKHDGKRDGVMYNKIYSDAHIQFDGNYGIKAPEYWVFRTTKDGDYLDVKEPTNEIDTNNREEINNFRGNYKKKYMASLKSWAESLPEFDGDVNSTKNDPLLKKESFEFDDIFN